MENAETIELNPKTETPVSAAPRGAKKSPKLTAVEPVAAASDRSSQTGRPVSKRTKPNATAIAEASKAKKRATNHAEAKPSAKNRGKSKKAQLIALLSKPNGTRISVIVERLGWQAHTVRAALSGLRKQGFVIATSKSAKTGETVYAITFVPDAVNSDEAMA